MASRRRTSPSARGNPAPNISTRCRDPDIAELDHWSNVMLEKMRAIPKLQDVTTDQQDTAPRTALKINRDVASRLGISAQAIDDTLYDAFGQRQVATMFTQLNQYHVVLEVDPKFQQDPSSLNAIYVKSASGAQVPLSAFTSFEPATSALSINHQGQFPAITISFNLAPGVALGDATALVQRAETEAHMPATVTATFQGNAQAFHDSLSTIPLLIAAALVAVYIVLGILYESFIHPLTILSTLPSAGVGALLMLWLFPLPARHDGADRDHFADRHREEERDHDDRFRAGGGASSGHVGRRVDLSGGACCGFARS